MATRLKAAARRTGKPFRQVVNETLRAGLTPRREGPPTGGSRFTIEARDLGRISPGLNLDNVGELLDRVESPEHR